MREDIAIFTITKNDDKTYNLICQNGFNSHARFHSKNLSKALKEITETFDNYIGMKVRFEYFLK